MFARSGLFFLLWGMLKSLSIWHLHDSLGLLF